MEELKRTPHERQRFLNRVLAIAILVLFAIVATLIYIYWYPTTTIHLRDGSDGSIIETYEIKRNSKLDALPTPEKEGHTFEAWYADSSLTELFDLSTPLTREVVDIYAKFIKNTYTITFIVSLPNGDRSDLFNTVTAEYGSSIYAPTMYEAVGLTADEARALFYKPGYEFVGWTPGNMYSTDAVQAVDVIMAGQPFNVSSSINTYYATWKSLSYNIDYYAGVIYDKGADGKAVKTNGVFTYQNKLDTVFATDSVHADKEFIVKDQPFVASLLLQTDTNLLDNTTYGMFFDSNESSLYSFKSWNTSSSLGTDTMLGARSVFLGVQDDGKIVVRDDSNTIVAYEDENKSGTISLYSNWGLKEYTISFYKNRDGVIGTMDPITMAKGSNALIDLGLAELFTVTLPECKFTLNNHKFVNWTRTSTGGGDSFTDGYKLINILYAEDLNLYANWQKMYNVVLTNGLATSDPDYKWFKLEGGCLEGEVVTLQGIEYYKKDGNQVFNTRFGFNFVGWKTEDGSMLTAPDGVSKSNTISAGGKFKMPAKDLVLKAEWIGKDVTIIYIGNGGKTADGNAEFTESSTYKYDARYQPRSNMFAFDTYRFVGWSLIDPTSSDYNSDCIIKDLQISVRLSSPNSDVMYIYAVWIKQYTITFKYNAGEFSGNVPASKTQDIGTRFELTVERGLLVASAGTFSGWICKTSDGNYNNRAYRVGDTIVVDNLSADMEFWAQLDSATVTVKFIGRDGSVTINWKTGQNIETPCETDSAGSIKITQVGKHFLGWNKKNNPEPKDIVGSSTIKNERQSIVYTWSDLQQNGIAFENLELTPVYQSKQYTVTFINPYVINPDGSYKVVKVVNNVEHGKLVTDWPIDPRVEGVDFKCWALATLDDNGKIVSYGTSYDRNTPIIGDTTLYADFSERMYTINFHYNYPTNYANNLSDRNEDRLFDSISVRNVSGKVGSAVRANDNIFKSGELYYYTAKYMKSVLGEEEYNSLTYAYIFTGMRTRVGGVEGGNLFEGDIEISPTNFEVQVGATKSTIDLYCTWQLRTVKIYYSNGLKDALGNSETHEVGAPYYGETITLATDIEFKNKPSYKAVFRGWSKVNGATNVITTDTLTETTYHNTDGGTEEQYSETYYAVWDSSFVVRYYDKDGKLYTIDDNSGAYYSGNSNNKCTLQPSPQVTGYSFTSWIMKNGTKPKKDMVGVTEFEIGDTKLMGVYAIEIKIGDKQCFAYDLYATYNINQYSVEFKYDDPEDSTKTDIDAGETLSNNYLENVTLHNDIKGKIEFGNYYLSGWKIGDVTYELGGTYQLGASNVTAKAVFSEKITITFMGNRNSGDTFKTTKTAIPASDKNATKVRMPQGAEFNNVTKAGYRHIGFAESKDSTSVTYGFNLDFKFNSNITLYAVWSADSVKVTYHNKYGAIDKTEEKTVKVDSSYTLLSATDATNAGFSRDNYVLVGWSKTEMSEWSKEGSYSVGSEHTITASDIAGVHYYAIWERLYTVKFSYKNVTTTTVELIKYKNYGDFNLPSEVKANNLTYTVTQPSNLPSSHKFDYYVGTIANKNILFGTSGNYTNQLSLTTIIISTGTVTENSDGIGVFGTNEYTCLPIVENEYEYSFDAVATVKTVTVTINYVNPKKPSKILHTNTQSVNYGENLILSVETPKEIADNVNVIGYEISGFTYGADTVTSINNITSDITLTSVWSKLYTITILSGRYSDCNFNTIIETKGNKLKDGSPITLPNKASIYEANITANLIADGKTPGKYVMLGYSLSEKGDTLAYKFGDTIETMTGDMELYPYIAKAYYLRFNAVGDAYGNTATWDMGDVLDNKYTSTIAYPAVDANGSDVIISLNDLISKNPSISDNLITFAGWGLNKDLDGVILDSRYKINPDNVVDADYIDIYSKWSHPSITVVVNKLLDKSIDTTTVPNVRYKSDIVVSGNKLTLTKLSMDTQEIDASESGYKFIGFYTDQACSDSKKIQNQLTLDNTLVTNATAVNMVNIYAKFDKYYTIHYDLNGGNLLDGVTVPNDIENVVIGKTVTLLDPSTFATMDNYNANGYEIVVGETHYEVADSFTLSSDHVGTTSVVTLYIKWDPKQVNVTLYYATSVSDYNNLVWQTSNMYDEDGNLYTGAIPYGTIVYLPNMDDLGISSAFSGYTILGYTKDAITQKDMLNNINTVSNDITLGSGGRYMYNVDQSTDVKIYMVLTSSQTYNVTFVAGNNGSIKYNDNGVDNIVSSDKSVTFTVKANASAPAVTAMPSVGYTFLGWFRDGASEAESTDMQFTLKNVSSSVGYTARFVEREDIQLNIQFVSLHNKDSSNSINVTYGENTYNITPNWNDSSVVVDGDTFKLTISNIVKYSNILVANATIAEFGYKLNGIKVRINDSALYDIPSSPNMFTEWITKLVADYTVDTQLTLDVVYEVEQIYYTLSINPNEGKFVDASIGISENNVDYTYDDIPNTSEIYTKSGLITSYFVKLPVPVREGYKFDGYLILSSDKYQDVTIGKDNVLKIKNDCEIVAQWKKVYTVKYIVQSAVGSQSKETTISQKAVVEGDSITIGYNVNDLPIMDNTSGTLIIKGDDRDYQSNDVLIPGDVFEKITVGEDEYYLFVLSIDASEHVIGDEYTVNNDIIISIKTSAKLVNLIYYTDDSLSQIVDPITNKVYEDKDMADYPYLSKVLGSTQALSVYSSTDTKAFIGWKILNNSTNSYDEYKINTDNLESALNPRSIDFVIDINHVVGDDVRIIPIFADKYTIKYNIGKAVGNIGDMIVLDLDNCRQITLTNIVPVPNDATLKFSTWEYVVGSDKTSYLPAGLFTLDDKHKTSDHVITLNAVYVSKTTNVVFVVTNPDDGSTLGEDFRATYDWATKLIYSADVPSVDSVTNGGKNITFTTTSGVTQTYTVNISDVFYQKAFLGFALLDSSDVINFATQITFDGLVDGGEIRVYTVWSNRYSLTYTNVENLSTDGGDLPDTQWLPAGETFTITSVTLQKSGYRFENWIDEDGVVYAPKDVNYMPSHNIVLSPVMTKLYTLTLNLNGEWANYISERNSMLEILVDCKEEESIREKINNYTNIYDLTMSTNTKGNVVSILITMDVAEGDSISINQLFTESKLSLTHFNFIGWMETQQTESQMYDYINGGATDVDAETSTTFTMGASDKTLYGVWNPNIYKVQFIDTFSGLSDTEKYNGYNPTNNTFKGQNNTVKETKQIPYLKPLNTDADGKVEKYAGFNTTGVQGNGPYFFYNSSLVICKAFTKYDASKTDYNARFSNEVKFTGDNPTLVTGNMDIYARGIRMYKVTYKMSDGARLKAVESDPSYGLYGGKDGEDIYYYMPANITYRLRIAEKAGYNLHGYTAYIDREQNNVDKSKLTIFAQDHTTMQTDDHIVWYAGSKIYDDKAISSDGEEQDIYFSDQSNGVKYDDTTKTYYALAPGAEYGNSGRFIAFGDNIILEPFMEAKEIKVKLMKPSLNGENVDYGETAWIEIGSFDTNQIGEVIDLSKVLPTVNTSLDKPNYSFVGWTAVMNGNVVTSSSNNAMFLTSAINSGNLQIAVQVNNLSSTEIMYYDDVDSITVYLYAKYQLTSTQISVSVKGYTNQTDARELVLLGGYIKTLSTSARNITATNHRPETTTNGEYYAYKLGVTRNNGTITGTITAVARTGATFAGWYVGDTLVSSNAELDISKILDNRNLDFALEARFSVTTRSVTFTGTLGEDNSQIGLYKFDIKYGDTSIYSTNDWKDVAMTINNVPAGSQITYQVMLRNDNTSLNVKYSDITHYTGIKLNNTLVAIDRITSKLNGTNTYYEFTTEVFKATDTTISSVFEANKVKLEYHFKTELVDDSISQNILDAYKQSDVTLITIDGFDVVLMPTANGKFTINYPDVTSANAQITAYNNGNMNAFNVAGVNPNYIINLIDTAQPFSLSMAKAYDGNRMVITENLVGSPAITVRYTAVNGTARLYEPVYETNSDGIRSLTGISTDYTYSVNNSGDYHDVKLAIGKKDGVFDNTLAPFAVCAYTSVDYYSFSHFEKNGGRVVRVEGNNNLFLKDYISTFYVNFDMLSDNNISAGVVLLTYSTVFSEDMFTVSVVGESANSSAFNSNYVNRQIEFMTSALNGDGDSYYTRYKGEVLSTSAVEKAGLTLDGVTRVANKYFYTRNALSNYITFEINSEPDATGAYRKYTVTVIADTTKSQTLTRDNNYLLNAQWIDMDKVGIDVDYSDIGKGVQTTGTYFAVGNSIDGVAISANSNIFNANFKANNRQFAYFVKDKTISADEVFDASKIYYVYYALTSSGNRVAFSTTGAGGNSVGGNPSIPLTSADFSASTDSALNDKLTFTVYAKYTYYYNVYLYVEESVALVEPFGNIHERMEAIDRVNTSYYDAFTSLQTQMANNDYNKNNDNKYAVGDDQYYCTDKVNITWNNDRKSLIIARDTGNATSVAIQLPVYIKTKLIMQWRTAYNESATDDNDEVYDIVEFTGTLDLNTLNYTDCDYDEKGDKRSRFTPNTADGHNKFSTNPRVSYDDTYTESNYVTSITCATYSAFPAHNKFTGVGNPEEVKLYMLGGVDRQNELTLKTNVNNGIEYVKTTTWSSTPPYTASLNTLTVYLQDLYGQITVTPNGTDYMDYYKGGYIEICCTIEISVQYHTTGGSMTTESIVFSANPKLLQIYGSSNVQWSQGENDFVWCLNYPTKTIINLQTYVNWHTVMEGTKLEFETYDSIYTTENGGTYVGDDTKLTFDNVTVSYSVTNSGLNLVINGTSYYISTTFAYDWYLCRFGDNNGTKLSNGDSGTLNVGVYTFKALEKQANQYSVTFTYDGDGAEGGMWDTLSISVTEGRPYQIMSNGVKIGDAIYQCAVSDGYTLDSISIAVENTGSYSENTISGNTTFTAHISKQTVVEPTTHTVTFTKTDEYGALGDWKTNSGAVVSSLTVAEDATLNAYIDAGWDVCVSINGVQTIMQLVNGYQYTITVGSRTMGPFVYAGTVPTSIELTIDSDTTVNILVQKIEVSETTYTINLTGENIGFKETLTSGDNYVNSLTITTTNSSDQIVIMTTGDTPRVRILNINYDFQKSSGVYTFSGFTINGKSVSGSTLNATIAEIISTYQITGSVINIVGHGIKNSSAKKINVYNGTDSTPILTGETTADSITVGGSINIYIGGATSSSSIRFDGGDYLNYTTSSTEVKGVKFNGTTYTKTGYWFTGWSTANATNTTGENPIHLTESTNNIYMCWSKVYTITINGMKPDSSTGWTYSANGVAVTDGIFATNALNITCYGTQHTKALNIPAVTASKGNMSYLLTRIEGTAGSTTHNPDVPISLAFDMTRSYECVWTENITNISINAYLNNGTTNEFVTLSAYKDMSNVYIPVAQYQNLYSKNTEYYTVGSIGKINQRLDLAGKGITKRTQSTFNGKTCYVIPISDFSQYYASSTGNTYTSYIQWKGVNEDKLTWNGTSIKGGNGDTIAIPDYYYNGSHFAVTTISIPGLKYSGNNYVTSTKISKLVIGSKISSITDIANMGVGTFVSKNSKYTIVNGCLIDGTTMLSAGKTSDWVGGYTYAPGAYMGNQTIRSVTNFNATLVPLLFYNSKITEITISGLGNTAGYGNPYSCNGDANKEGEWNFQVGYNCFNGSSLSSISFANGYTTSVSVEDYAFSGCNMGSGFGLFNYITRVDSNGLANCGDMSSFDASNWSMNYCWENAFANTKLPAYVTITATKVGKNCFADSGIFELTINTSSKPLLRKGNSTQYIGGSGRELGEIGSGDQGGLVIPNLYVRGLMIDDDNFNGYNGIKFANNEGEPLIELDEQDVETTPTDKVGNHVAEDENGNKQVGETAVSEKDKIVVIDAKYILTSNYVRKLLMSVEDGGVLYICGTSSSIPSEVRNNIAFYDKVKFMILYD